MIKIIRGDDWCKIIDNDKLIYEGHNLDEAYLDYYAIEWSDD